MIAPAVIDSLIRGGAAREQMAAVGKAQFPEIGPAIDALYSTGASAEMLGEVIKRHAGSAEAREAAKRERERVRKANKRAATKHVDARPRMAPGARAIDELPFPQPPPLSADTRDSADKTDSADADAGSLSSSLSSSFSSFKIDDDDDDDDARARGRQLKNLAEQTAAEVERIVQSALKMRPGGWNHSVLVEQIERRLKIGMRHGLILDAVRAATERAPGPIYSFNYFDSQIAKAHSEANQEPTLPLAGTSKSTIQGDRHDGDSMQAAAAAFADEFVELCERAQAADQTDCG